MGGAEFGPAGGVAGGEGGLSALPGAGEARGSEAEGVAAVFVVEMVHGGH